jgi:hypothetical protein
LSLGAGLPTWRWACQSDRARRGCRARCGLGSYGPERRHERSSAERNRRLGGNRGQDAQVGKVALLTALEAEDAAHVATARSTAASGPTNPSAARTVAETGLDHFGVPLGPAAVARRRGARGRLARRRGWAVGLGQGRPRLRMALGAVGTRRAETGGIERAEGRGDVPSRAGRAYKREDG